MPKNKLDIILGFSIQRISRTVNMLELGLGDIVETTDIHGKLRNIERYAIHIQSPWRLLLDKAILIASSDMYEPNTKTEWSEDFNWEVYGANLFDELCETKIKELLNHISVEEVVLDDVGGLRIVFDSGHVLETFSDTSSTETELWRFFEMSNYDSHLVAYVDRLEM